MKIPEALRQRIENDLDARLMALQRASVPANVMIFLVKAVKEFRCEVWPDESKHRGRPHCKVTLNDHSATVDIRTFEILAGDLGPHATCVLDTLEKYAAELLEAWNSKRPDTQKLPAQPAAAVSDTPKKPEKAKRGKRANAKRARKGRKAR